MDTERGFIIGSSVALVFLLLPTILNAFMIFLLSGAIPGTKFSLPANLMLISFSLLLIAAILYIGNARFNQLVSDIFAKRHSIWKRLPAKRFKR